MNAPLSAAEDDRARRDPGLQPERTALAWRRTALALVVGALISMRLLPPVLGPWSMAFGVVGAMVGTGVLILEHRRFIRHGVGARLPKADGVPVALLAGSVLVAAALCLVLVLAP